MGRTSPNPPVAAIITDADGNILSYGNTQAAGLDHAERDAYRKLDLNLSDHRDLITDQSRKHHIYVSLEPCTHTGKTPPCRDLVLERAPKQVILGWKDPNPLVDSGGWDPYRNQNIEIKLHPLLAQGALPFLQGFFQRIKKERPWVWIKSAITSDGYYAPEGNMAVSISSKASQFYLQMLRAKFDAIVVGPNTVQVDQPGLNFRLDESDFETKGDVTKIDFGNVVDFFSPGEQLLDTLFAESTLDTYTEHLSKIATYQPWRVFILKEGMEIGLEFLKKQQELNEKYDKKLCLFYILTSKDNANVFSSDTLRELSNLTDFPLVKILDMKSDVFFKDLVSHGINTVILEAGSFLWNLVKENLDTNDCILTIQSEMEMKHGKKFLGLGHFEKQAHYQVGSDLWQIEMKS